MQGTQGLWLESTAHFVPTVFAANALIQACLDGHPAAIPSLTPPVGEGTGWCADLTPPVGEGQGKWPGQDAQPSSQEGKEINPALTPPVGEGPG